MKVVVTGATGFIGRHVVRRLIENGHEVVALCRDIERAKGMDWFNQVDFMQCDLQKHPNLLFDTVNQIDSIIHLACTGLPDYRGFFHISQNLPTDLAFLNAAVESGVTQLIVAGTCLEYGLVCGPLAEEMETNPITPYGFYKDTLRKSLQFMQKEKLFTLQWMRLFYMYGEGQNKKSLLAQLDNAIKEKHEFFNMSKGDQLRDYLPVSQVANYFCLALEHPEVEGVINCCSGSPVSILDLVKNYCKQMASNIALNPGYYSYPDYEPFEFWGIPKKIKKLEI